MTLLVQFAWGTHKYVCKASAIDSLVHFEEIRQDVDSYVTPLCSYTNSFFFWVAPKSNTIKI